MTSQSYRAFRRPIMQPFISKPFYFSRAMVFPVHDTPQLVGRLAAVDQDEAGSVGHQRGRVLTKGSLDSLLFAPKRSFKDGVIQFKV